MAPRDEPAQVRRRATIPIKQSGVNVNKKLFLMLASFVFAGAASAAVSPYCHQVTDFQCTLRCYNGFIVCKSTSYEAAPCQNAYNACVAGCNKWVCFSDHI